MSRKYLIITVAVLAAYVLMLVALAWYTTDGGNGEEHAEGEHLPSRSEVNGTTTTGRQWRGGRQ